MKKHLKRAIVFLMAIAIVYSTYTLYYIYNRQNQHEIYNGSVKISSVHTTLNVLEKEKLHVIFLGDARWNANTRIAALQKAESMKPDMIINLADPVDRGTNDLFSNYNAELVANWSKTPFFHIPGGHSRNPHQLYLGLSGYEQYFGQTNYVVKVPEFKMKFIMLDNSALFFFPHQLLWLDKELAIADEEGDKVILNMHAPPIDPRMNGRKAMLISTDWLGKIVNRHKTVLAIFSAHTHENVETTWQGIPLEILGVSGASTDGSDKVKVWSLEITKDYKLHETHINVYEK